MTSPARVSTWTSLKPRSAAKQALEARMWRLTPARWRNSPRLERWPVAEQLTQTKRVTVTVCGRASLAVPALDAITATSNRVQTTWMHVIAFRAKWWKNTHARAMWHIYGMFEPGHPVYKQTQNCTASHVASSCNACAGREKETKGNRETRSREEERGFGCRSCVG